MAASPPLPPGFHPWIRWRFPGTEFREQNFQCSRLTLSGSNPFGAKLPFRREAETTITYGTNTNARRLITMTCEIASRATAFCCEFNKGDFTCALEVTCSPGGAVVFIS